MRIKTILTIGAMLILSSIAALALDLRFTTVITQAPSPANVGDSVQFTVSFKNFDDPVTNLKIVGGIDGAQLFERTYASILANKVKTDFFTWTATAGAHTAWFEVDPDHTTGDSDYTNNRVEKAFTVGGGPAGQPNLKPTVTYSPSNFAAGDTVTFTLRVNNNGTADAVASKMQVIKGAADLLQTYNVAAITIGGHIDKTYSWTAECDAHITVKVDSNNANTESNEGDNIWTQAMACGDTGGDPGPVVCIPCLRYLEWREWVRIPLPNPCLSCPDWHITPEFGDPIDVLDKIGDKLGQGLGFEDIKGDWALFLKNPHGLDPNAALKLVFDRAVGGAKVRIRNTEFASKFRIGLNLAIGKMHDAIASEFAVK